MLIRLAKVVWWFGLLLALLAVLEFAMPRIQLGSLDCDAVARARAAADEKQVALATAAAAAQGKQPSAWDLTPSGPQTADEQACGDAKRRYVGSGEIAGMLLVTTILSWAAAFVLGGSFWRPPSTRSARSTSRALV